MRFNAHGPDGLIDHRRLGNLPSSTTSTAPRMIEDGLTPAIHGVVRWRIVDLCQWVFEEFRIAIAEQTMSRELRKMGYRKRAARSANPFNVHLRRLVGHRCHHPLRLELGRARKWLGLHR